ncbi:protein AF-10 isoform X5 [Nerophis ophidion]|uniref:protein AF-10 isoform X5 n=1 Tax=Nerophis ophidion TaxID=159077 RepID=UPI002ADFAA3E|nr:protein AF-10 isoform X5 [Nerophis ophidion]
MVSGERCLLTADKLSTSNMKEMIGGCCVCSDERGWAENPLVYCDGHGCNVAVHQACYGIVQVPTGPWFCRKCESQERAARVRCELCPHKDGALKRTDNGGWAHVVCALYIPEVEFANVSTMEPIVLQSVPNDRYNKTCYICEDQGRESKAACGACMTCNKHGCRQAFHVTCAQFAGLLCEEQGSDADNVKYCGYCKYHHSKLRRSRGSGSRSQSLSDSSSSQCMDRPPDQDQQKHKERDRHKPKHRKTSMDMSPSLVLPNIMIPEKPYSSSGSVGGGVPLPAALQKRLDEGSARFTNANFQEVSSTHSVGSSKDCLATDPGKVPSDMKSKKNASGSHTVGQRCGRKSLTSSGKALPSTVVTMATSSTSASVSSGPFHQVGGKLYENSHSLSASETTSLSGSAAYKRPQSSSTGPGITGAAVGGLGGEDGVKKKKKGNWRNRFGPCFTTDVKPSESAPSLTLPISSTGNTSSSAASPSSSSALSSRPGLVSSGGLGVGGGAERALGVIGVGGGIQKSPSLLRNGSGVFSGVDASLGPGTITMGGVPAEHPQPTPSLTPPSPFTATAPLTSMAVTHVSGLPGSVFNMAPSHMFGNRLNPNSAMAALIAQSEASPADQEAGDGSVGVQGFSIRASPKTTPHSPIGGLQIRYDPSGSLPGPGLGLLGAGGGEGVGEALPPVATTIEQLLERQWNEGQSFLLQQGAQGDVVAMLKSLHQLQQENRKLEEQIKTLTMKKERLQLLSAQLSVPFTPASASSDVKGAVTDSSLPVAAQDSASSGGHSSSGSTSSLSTPPSLSQSPPQPQLNGISAPGATPVSGLMGTFGAGSALGMGGVTLNGVIQTSAGSPHAITTITLPGNNSSGTSKTSAARLALSDTQRLLIQQHQLQQLLSSQPSAEHFH